MKTIEEVRKEIDELDDKLTAAFLSRIKLAAKIGDKKRACGAPVEDVARENEIIERLTRGLSEKESMAVKSLYDRIFSLCKAAQK